MARRYGFLRGAQEGMGDGASEAWVIADQPRQFDFRTLSKTCRQDAGGTQRTLNAARIYGAGGAGRRNQNRNRQRVVDLDDSQIRIVEWPVRDFTNLGGSILR